MTALAGIHRADTAKLSYLGDFWGFEFDVTRWDRFYERAAEPQLPRPADRVRETAPLTHPRRGSRIGLYHGDFQWANMIFQRRRPT